LTVLAITGEIENDAAGGAFRGVTMAGSGVVVVGVHKSFTRDTVSYFVLHDTFKE
jgi:hypothetical protein